MLFKSRVCDISLWQPLQTNPASIQGPWRSENNSKGWKVSAWGAALDQWQIGRYLQLGNSEVRLHPHCLHTPTDISLDHFPDKALAPEFLPWGLLLGEANQEDTLLPHLVYPQPH